MRHGMNDHRVASESLDLEAGPSKNSAKVLDERELGRGESHGEREEKTLTGGPAGFEPRHDPFEQYPFMRGVLVDEQEAIPDFGEDPGIMDLPEPWGLGR
jgi:hypothetical protein